MNGYAMAAIITVRSREQILDVVDLAHTIWTDHYVPIIGPEQVGYMLARFQSEDAIASQLFEGYEYFILSHGGKPAGYIAIVPDTDAGMLMISKFYVLETERGRGFGRLMLEHAERVCREREIHALWLTVNRNNTSSIAWYQRMGFRNTGSTIQDIGGGFVMDDYRMEKRVSPTVITGHDSP